MKKNILIIVSAVNFVSLLVVCVLHANLQKRFNNLYTELEEPVLSQIRAQEEANKPRNIGEKIQNVVNDTDVALGGKDAKVTIVKYNSFSCGYCKLAAGVINQIHKAYPKRVKIVYKHFNRGGIDELTSQAIECAGEQNKFWEVL